MIRMDFFSYPWITISLSALIVYVFYQQLLRLFSKYPIPPLIPFFGNALALAPETLLPTLEHYAKHYGGIVQIYLFSKRGYVISDLQIAKEIFMKRPKKFRRTPLTEYPSDVLNTRSGLFASEGHVWSRIRKATAPSFSNLNIANKYSAMTQEMIRWIGNIYKRSLQSPSQHVDMKKEAFRLSIRVITIVAFGLETTDPLCAYFFNELPDDVEIIFKFIGDFTFFPGPRWLWRYSPQYAIEIAVREVDQRLTAACQRVIDFKRTQAKEGKLLMNCMIDAMIVRGQTGEDEAGGLGEAERGLSDDEIIANVKVFYLAGSDTTSTTITWILYYFALNPSIAQKVADETKEILFGGNALPSLEQLGQLPEEDPFMQLVGSWTINSTKEMKFTSAVIKETLRLYSPASNAVFETNEEETVLSNGLTVYKGESLIVNMDGIHITSKAFTEPEKYYPERWIESSPEQLKQMEDSFVPFGFGPRICPGMNLAHHESLLAIIFIALYFNLSLDCPIEEIKKQYTFVTVPNKMPLLFRAKSLD